MAVCAGESGFPPALCNASEATTTRAQLLSLFCSPPAFTAPLCRPEAALGDVRGPRNKGLSRVTVDSGSVCGEGFTTAGEGAGLRLPMQVHMPAMLANESQSAPYLLVTIPQSL